MRRLSSNLGRRRDDRRHRRRKRLLRPARPRRAQRRDDQHPLHRQRRLPVGRQHQPGKSGEDRADPAHAAQVQGRRTCGRAREKSLRRAITSDRRDRPRAGYACDRDAGVEPDRADRDYGRTPAQCVRDRDRCPRDPAGREMARPPRLRRDAVEGRRIGPSTHRRHRRGEGDSPALAPERDAARHRLRRQRGQPRRRHPGRGR